MPSIEPSVIIAYAFGLILIYFIFKLFYLPVKLVLKLVYNAVIGGLMLYALNFIGQYFDFTVAINAITALTVGFLGIPGLILLVALKIFFGWN
ncbi:MAG: pro-sigmaK processing inhibitor BofA family protein [Sporomusaceae bacterium]|nr:pro-sigmaK processing inhibitor BofA family protein [Sporomusaceae bacterium]